MVGISLQYVTPRDMTNTGPSSPASCLSSYCLLNVVGDTDLVSVYPKSDSFSTNMLG